MYTMGCKSLRLQYYLTDGPLGLPCVLFTFPDVSCFWQLCLWTRNSVLHLQCSAVMQLNLYYWEYFNTVVQLKGSSLSLSADYKWSNRCHCQRTSSGQVAVTVSGLQVVKSLSLSGDYKWSNRCHCQRTSSGQVAVTVSGLQVVKSLSLSADFKWSSRCHCQRTTSGQIAVTVRGLQVVKSLTLLAYHNKWPNRCHC